MTDCVMECRAKLTIETCGCLPYFYPKFKSTSDRDPSCNATGLKKLAENYGKRTLLF